MNKKNTLIRCVFFFCAVAALLSGCGIAKPHYPKYVYISSELKELDPSKVAAFTPGYPVSTARLLEMTDLQTGKKYDNDFSRYEKQGHFYLIYVPPGQYRLKYSCIIYASPYSPGRSRKTSVTVNAKPGLFYDYSCNGINLDVAVKKWNELPAEYYEPLSRFSLDDLTDPVDTYYTIPPLPKTVDPSRF